MPLIAQQCPLSAATNKLNHINTAQQHHAKQRGTYICISLPVKLHHLLQCTGLLQDICRRLLISNMAVLLHMLDICLNM
jgi:hypothetical protein